MRHGLNLVILKPARNPVYLWKYSIALVIEQVNFFTLELLFINSVYKKTLSE